MPIYFIRTPVREPFIFDSIGNHWEKKPAVRKVIRITIICRQSPERERSESRAGRSVSVWMKEF